MPPNAPTLTSRQFAQLLSEALSTSPEAERVAPFVFHLLPGATEVAQRFAAYVCDLPLADGSGTIFSRSLVSAILAVDRLGAVPWTTVNHVAGFPVFVGALVFDVADLARLRVEWPAGGAWRASAGPFALHRSRYGRSVEFTDVQPGVSELVALRVQLLTNMISSTDLAKLASSWRSILLAGDHAS